MGCEPGSERRVEPAPMGVEHIQVILETSALRGHNRRIENGRDDTARLIFAENRLTRAIHPLA